jgi:hypothetical protein
MKLKDYFSLKNNYIERSNRYSLRFGRNHYVDKINKNFFKSDMYYNSPYYLPKINKLTTLKKFSNEGKYLSKRTKFQNNIMNNNNKLLLLKNNFNSKKNKEIESINYKEKNYEYLTLIMNNKGINKNKFNKIQNKDKNKKENNNDIKSTNNRIKDLRKIINIYYKNDKQDENKNKIELEKKNKTGDKIRTNNQNNTFLRTNSMFMTEMNFLISDKNKRKNKIKEIISKNEIISEDNNSKFESMSFKELLKHIENNKRKIIDNQNDIDKMLKTAKDTHYEIWKYNNHHHQI